MRSNGGLLAGLLAVGAAAASAQPALASPPPPPPATPTLTPAGPATLSSQWRGAVTSEGRPPHVLQAVTITVAPGGAAGQVRVRVSDPEADPRRGVLLGDWFTLPAEPGTYTFPAPRLLIDYRSVVLALDQQTGGHAIAQQRTCRYELGRGEDWCQLVALDVWVPILADGLGAVPPDLRPGGPQPAERRPGEQLRIEEISEIDVDGDLAGDRTEDRTDLVVRGEAVRGPGGRMTITVTNRGPRTADRPRVTIDRPRSRGWSSPARGWTPACATPQPRFQVPPPADGTYCDLPSIAPGRSHRVSLPTPADGRPVRVKVTAEAPDLTAADNAVTVVPRLASAPAARLTVAARADATRGVDARLRSERAATARLTLSVRHGGRLRTTARTVKLRAGAARTVTVGPVRAGGAVLAGRARLTVTISAPDSETRRLTRNVRLVP